MTETMIERVAREPYKIELTHAAQVEAQKRPGGAAAVEAWAREEVDALLADGLGSLADLCFHTLMKDEPEFICFPSDDLERLMVDACGEEESLGPLESGPFAGKRVVMPTRFGS